MGTEGQAKATGGRLAQVDALRGVAALAVVLFHYTTAFSERYAPQLKPTLSAPHGHLGVNLFFIISGFVIFMTLMRTRRPMDFVVSRFSRLFPAYWVAVGLTFGVVTMFGLPSKEVTPLQAVANLAMIHGFFRVPHVDGVYWTLEVELLFYAGMFSVFMLRRVDRLYWVLGSLLALRFVYHIAAQAFHVDLPWMVGRLLIIKHIPWFVLGIFVYQRVLAPSRTQDTAATITAGMAVACLMVVDGWAMALIALGLLALVWAAASSRLPFLDNALFGFFGAISYTLYLVHENIGWVVERAVIARGGSIDSSIVIALAAAIMLAAALTYAIERPAMEWIRARYRRQDRLAQA